MQLYDAMTTGGQRDFRSAMQKLAFEGSLVFQLPADKSAFRVILESREMAEELLGYFDLRLEISESDGLIYTKLLSINGEWELEQIRRRDEIALLAIFRSALEEERSRTGRGFSGLTVTEVRTRYEANMNGARLKAAWLDDILPKFKRMKLIDYRGSPKDIHTKIFILPNFLRVTPDTITDLIELVQDQNGEHEDDDES